MTTTRRHVTSLAVRTAKEQRKREALYRAICGAVSAFDARLKNDLSPEMVLDFVYKIQEARADRVERKYTGEEQLAHFTPMAVDQRVTAAMNRHKRQ